MMLFRGHGYLQLCRFNIVISILIRTAKRTGTDIVTERCTKMASQHADIGGNPGYGQCVYYLPRQ